MGRNCKYREIEFGLKIIHVTEKLNKVFVTRPMQVFQKYVRITVQDEVSRVVTW